MLGPDQKRSTKLQPGRIPALALLLTASTLVALVSCGDSDAPNEAPIELPGRDGATSEPDAPACDTTSDPNNCGRCGNVCPSGPRGAAACGDGRCVVTCESGWADCNGDAADGCETNVSTSMDHCGACGHACGACGGAACTSGVCEAKTLSARPNDVSLLAVDDKRVVYADASGVSQVDKGDASVLGVYNVPSTPGLLVDGNVLFIYPGKEAFSGIYSTSPGFVGPQIAAFARGEDAEAMAVDATGLYYAVVKTNGVSRLLRCKDCSVPTELAPNENSFRTNAIAVDTTTVFFGAGDMIRRVEKTATDLKTIAVGQKPRSLGVDATHVYWINEAPFTFGKDAGTTEGEVVRMPKAGGPPEKIVTGLARPTFLVVGETHLYITDRGNGLGNGVLFRTTKAGQSRLDLARGVTALGGMTVDTTCAWFAAGGQIRKVAR